MPEFNEVEFEDSVPQEVETAILKQNMLNEKIDELDKKITYLKEQVEDDFNYITKSFEEDIEKLTIKMNQPIKIENPEVTVKTIKVDKSKEFKDQIFAVEDSIRLTVNSLFVKLDNKFDLEINKLKKRSQVLTFMVILITLIAIIK